MDKATLISELTGLFGEGASIGFGRIIVSIVIAMALGIVLSFIYRGYFHIHEPQDRSISRSFPLMTPAITMIFILIQFSLPLSLGLLGALSFVRFRTPIKRSEDIAFILVMIAIGLSCAILYFHAAISLLLLLTLYGVLRHYFPLFVGNPSSSALATLHTSEIVDFDALSTAITPQFGLPTLISTQSGDNAHSLVFSLKNHTQNKNTQLISALAAIAGHGVQVDIYFPDNQLTE